MPDGAGAAGAMGVAARGAAAPGWAGMTGSDAAPGRVGVAGAGCAGAEYWRCIPKLRPDPRRLASATPTDTSVMAVTIAVASTNDDFMVPL